MAVAAAREDLFRFSASRLEAFRCPHRWMVHYILGQPEPDTEATVVGTAVHDAVEAIVNYTKEKGLAEFPKPRSKIVSAFVEEFTKTAQAVAAAKDIELTKTDVEEIGRMIRRGIEILQGIDPATVQIEHHIVLRLPDEFGPGEIQVYIDILVIAGKEGRIIDLKTGRIAYDVLDDPKVQLPLYGWVAAREFPDVESWNLELHFLRVGITATHPYDDAARERAESYLRERTKAIREAVAHDAFPPAPGHHCSFCPIAANCPAALEQVAEGEMPPEDLFGLYLATEARLALLRERLQRIVREHGPISLGGEYLGFYQTVTNVWNGLKETSQLLTVLGLNPEDYMVWDQAKLRRLAEKYPQLLKLADRKVSIRFEHKAEPPEPVF